MIVASSFHRKTPSSNRLFFFSLTILILAITVLPIIISRLNLLSRQWVRPAFLRHLSPGAQMSYEKELHIAQLAVQRAALLTQRVFHEKVKGTISKDDKSPVTIGDFGSQALILHAIRKNFPNDEIVGEEEASALRENHILTNQIWEFVRQTKLDDQAAEVELGGAVEDVEQMLQAIDAGNSAGGPKGRMWVLDPIDGTKGFLRGGQYAVCLALIEDGDVKVGVLGCPNLPVDDSAPLSADVVEQGLDGESSGVLFSAVKGSGATNIPLGRRALQNGKPIHMKEVLDITQAAFCEGVEPGHSSHDQQAAIAKKLCITRESVRMDSQAKYGSIARGSGDIYLRLPVSATYKEKIWDHASGDLIVKEAGGKVTDAQGQRLDFGKGRVLEDNKGIVAAPQGVHGQVLDAVKSVLSSK